MPGVGPSTFRMGDVLHVGRSTRARAPRGPLAGRAQDSPRRDRSAQRQPPPHRYAHLGIHDTLRTAHYAANARQRMREPFTPSLRQTRLLLLFEQPQPDGHGLAHTLQ